MVEKEDDLKFSAVLGTISAKSSILILPAGMLPMVTSKKTIGFLGFGGRTCHSTLLPPNEAAIEIEMKSLTPRLQATQDTAQCNASEFELH